MSYYLSVSGNSDFEQLQPITFTNINSPVDIRLFTANDEIALEYNDRVLLEFTPSNPAVIAGLEGVGEYIRDCATVNIIDNDCKWFLPMFIST